MGPTAPLCATSYRGSVLGHGETALWSAVVQQALDDLDDPRDRLIFADAVSFFTGSGDWARSRVDVADHLMMHPDYISLCGRREIARLQAAGVIAKDLLDPVAPHPAPRRYPLPRLVATFLPPPKPVRHRFDPKRGRESFNPYRQLAREA
jgi:hypothetical protein